MRGFVRVRSVLREWLTPVAWLPLQYHVTAICSAVLVCKLDGCYIESYQVNDVYELRNQMRDTRVLKLGIHGCVAFKGFFTQNLHTLLQNIREVARS